MTSRPPLSRRDFLRGRVHRPHESTHAEAGEHKSLEYTTRASDSPAAVGWQSTAPHHHGLRAPSNVALPKVISWLEPYLEGASPETPRRPHHHAPLLRPPGAVAEEIFLERCAAGPGGTGCTACASACPHQAIVFAPPSAGRAQGTPRIVPSTSPCLVCDDLPCIGACPEGALVPNGDRMGTARIQTHDCLNAMGSECRVCLERCPVNESGAEDPEGASPHPVRHAAIIWRNGFPEVIEATCIGCGVCHYVCPSPQNAVMILPNPERRALPDEVAS